MTSHLAGLHSSWGKKADLRMNLVFLCDSELLILCTGAGAMMEEEGACQRLSWGSRVKCLEFSGRPWGACVDSTSVCPSVKQGSYEDSESRSGTLARCLPYSKLFSWWGRLLCWKAGGEMNLDLNSIQHWAGHLTHRNLKLLICKMGTAIKG